MAKIIIIDDEPAMVEVIVTLCREKGHQVFPFNAPSKALEQLDSIQPQVVITLERTVCYGTCPAYTLRITGDGSVEYEGMRYVRVIGKATARISPARRFAPPDPASSPAAHAGP